MAALSVGRVGLNFVFCPETVSFTPACPSKRSLRIDEGGLSTQWEMVGQKVDMWGEVGHSGDQPRC
jgi:hypothetical protein